ncbi:MAG: RagB/SusD family nutrient uptake outer membrane protein [Paludibacter sp.]|nr:RagB/SusD family nutrient uptake outer membrane protein [Paludibacter sp.]
MKTKIYLILALVTTVMLSSCNDYLTPTPLAIVKLSDYFTSDTAAIAAVNAAYVPLQWQYGSNGLTYGNEWFIGDVVSDDALKGGGGTVGSDMNTVYLMENFQGSANNNYLETLYTINYQGIFRTNFAMENINGMQAGTITQAIKDRLIGESKFLRAYYHFRLMRLFGGIIKGDRTFTQSDALMARSSKEEIDKFIRQDLEDAIKLLPLKSEYASTELGRATKGSAQAMLMRVILFDINESFANKTADYAHVISLGDSIIASNQYQLKVKYQDFFKTFYNIPAVVAKFVEENGPESVFEVQYISESTSDWGGSAGGLGMTRGNFDPLVTRSRGGGLAGVLSASSQTGYGFNRPTQDLYDEFEPGDNRRDEAILPYDSTDVYGTEAEHFYNDGYHARKATLGFWVAYKGKQIFINPTFYAMRSPSNTFIIRYSDVLLMYGEAKCESNDVNGGAAALNLVRQRAKNSSTNPLDPTILPLFPYGGYTNDQTGLRAAIRHERRVEFAMEGQRWFDLVRWRTAEQVMNAYRQKYITKEGKDMSAFDPNKHYLFPIPETQLNANPLLKQNPGY